MTSFFHLSRRSFVLRAVSAAALARAAITLSATNFASVHDDTRDAARSPPACVAPSPASPQR